MEEIVAQSESRRKAKQEQNVRDHAKRPKGIHRSAEQIAAKHEQNANRPQGSDRSKEQVTAKQEQNEKRPKGSKRSIEQIRASKASNDKRNKGSDRTAKELASVRSSNWRYYLTHRNPRTPEEKHRHAVERLRYIFKNHLSNALLMTQRRFMETATSRALSPCFKRL